MPARHPLRAQNGPQDNMLIHCSNQSLMAVFITLTLSIAYIAIAGMATAQVASTTPSLDDGTHIATAVCGYAFALFSFAMNILILYIEKLIEFEHLGGCRWMGGIEKTVSETERQPLEVPPGRIIAHTGDTGDEEFATVQLASSDTDSDGERSVIVTKIRLPGAKREAMAYFMASAIANVFIIAWQVLIFLGQPQKAIMTLLAAALFLVFALAFYGSESRCPVRGGSECTAATSTAWAFLSIGVFGSIATAAIITSEFES